MYVCMNVLCVEEREREVQFVSPITPVPD